MQQQMQQQNASYLQQRLANVTEARMECVLPAHPGLSSPFWVVTDRELANLQDGGAAVINTANQLIQTSFGTIHGGIPVRYNDNIPHRPRTPHPPIAPPPPVAIALPHAVPAIVSWSMTTGKKIHRVGTIVKNDAKHAAQRINEVAHHAAHHGHSFRLPANMVLPFIAGTHGNPEVFATAVDGLTRSDLDAINDQLGRGKPYFTGECLRAVVEDAAATSVVGNPVAAGNKLRLAHHLIAIYLGNQPKSAFNADAQALFQNIMTIVGPGTNPQHTTGTSRYFGALVGLSLAGVLRFGCDEQKRIAKRRDQFVTALNLAAAAIGGATFPGIGTVTGVITAFAGPLASHLFADQDINEQLMALGGNLEASIRRGPPPLVDPQALCDTMQETIHRCGFAF